MSNTANDILPTLVPKLDVSGANWVIFVFCFQIGKGLWEHFDGSIPCPVSFPLMQSSPDVLVTAPTSTVTTSNITQESIDI